MDSSPKGVNTTTAIVKVILKSKDTLFVAREDEMQALLKNYTASH